MKKELIVIILSVLCVTCLDSNNKEKSSSTSNIDLKTDLDDSIIHPSKSILDYITDLLLSSDLKDLEGWPKESIYIYSEEYKECDNFIYCFRVMSAHNPAEQEVNDATVAILCYNAIERQFYDIFSEPKLILDLKYDRKIEDDLLNKIHETCASFRLEEGQFSSNNRDEILFTSLPFDFEEYYQLCIYPSNEKECFKRYPKYTYNSCDSIAKIIGNNYYPSEYLFLPPINNFTPLILCNTNSDIESYDLIILSEQKVISSLQIGLMDGNRILEFNIDTDYKIKLYTKESMSSTRELFKIYVITKDGKILE